MKTLLITLLSFSALFSLQAAQPTNEALTKELSAVMKSPYDGNSEFLLKHMHPDVVKSIGKETIVAGIQQFKTKMKAAGISFNSVKVKEIFSYITTDKHEFFCAAITLTLNTANGEKSTELVELGVKIKGQANWCYLDASNFTVEQLRQMFADIPANYSITPPKKPEQKPEKVK